MPLGLSMTNAASMDSLLWWKGFDDPASRRRSPLLHALRKLVLAGAQHRRLHLRAAARAAEPRRLRAAIRGGSYSSYRSRRIGTRGPWRRAPAIVHVHVPARELA